MSSLQPNDFLKPVTKIPLSIDSSFHNIRDPVILNTQEIHALSELVVMSLGKGTK